MTNERTGDHDLEFIKRVYSRSGGSLDTVVRGDEVGQELGLDAATSAEILERLVRMGFLRDVAAPSRVKITIRTITWLMSDREPVDSGTPQEFE